MPAWPVSLPGWLQVMHKEEALTILVCINEFRHCLCLTQIAARHLLRLGFLLTLADFGSGCDSSSGNSRLKLKMKYKHLI